MHNYSNSYADMTYVHLAKCREKDGVGGGALDVLAAFRHKFKLDHSADVLLRPLPHKVLRYVINNYDGSKELAEVIEEGKASLPEDGVTEGCMPDAPGMAAL